MSTQQPQRAKGRAEELLIFGPNGGFARRIGWAIKESQYDAIVERMARAMHRWECGPLGNRMEKRIVVESWDYGKNNYIAKAIAALTGIGIAAPRKERGSR